MSIKVRNNIFSRSFLSILILGGFSSWQAIPFAAEETLSLGEMTVTGTREEQLRSETSETTDVIDQKTIEEVRPAHPSELMNRIPGVHVNVTGGEGHMTAIRQPITTKPVYLYLEDGIPTRSTGFFNHNALYEINVPQSGGFVFKEKGSYIITAKFEADGEPYNIDFPLQIGESSSMLPIGIALGSIVLVLVAVNIVQRKRLMREKIRDSRNAV